MLVIACTAGRGGSHLAVTLRNRVWVRKLDPVLDRNHSPGVGGGGGDWRAGRNCTLKSFVRFSA